MSSPASPYPPSTLLIPTSPSLSRAPSILISPRVTPLSAPQNGLGGNTLNSLATVETSQEKRTKIEVFAPKVEEELRTFDKTLSSDVSQAEAINLLQKIDEKTSLFKEFTFHDMAYLAQVLTILKFSPGDVIIEAGEESSFVGMILSGELQVRFGDVIKPIPEGSLLGELSFFEGGTRTAAVSAGTESIVGMITFNELELLAEYAPTIRLKLMVLFALEGIKKMRLFSKPPQTPGSEEKAKEAEAAAPYNQSKPIVNKRASLDNKKLSPSTSQTSIGLAPPPDTKQSSDGGGARNRSLRRAGSLMKDGLNLPPGALNDKAAPAVPDPKSNRHVEALFRIRMKNEQKAQQEKIEKALEKRKNAEHRAKTTSVIAESFKRDLDKKQEFIEELYQENLDLKEYKEWAKKKHIADAKFLKEKLESSAELVVQLSIETEKRKVQQRLNEEFHMNLERRVTERTQTYVDRLGQLRLDIEKLEKGLIQSEQQRSELETRLSNLQKQHTAYVHQHDESIKQYEDEKLHTSLVTQDQLESHQHSQSLAQDEISSLKTGLHHLQQHCYELETWKEDAIEQSLQKEMVHQRMYRNLLENIEKHSSLISEVSSYKTILKYVLTSILVKNFRRRKSLKNIFLEQFEMIRKLNMEVTHQAMMTNKFTKGSSSTLATLPSSHMDGSNTTNTNSNPNATSSGVVDLSFGLDSYDSSTDPISTIGSIDGIGGGVRSVRNSNKTFASQAKQDELFIRILDSLPTLRTLIDEICSQKVYWNATADSFFRRTIELKQQMMDLEQTTGVRLVQNGITTTTTTTIGTPRDTMTMNSKMTPILNDDGHVLETTSQNQNVNKNFYYQESKEEGMNGNGNGANGGSSTSRTSRSKRSTFGPTSTTIVDADDVESPHPATEHLKPPPTRSGGGGGGGTHGRRGSDSVSPSSSSGGGHGFTSMSEWKETREKMVYYKRRVKEYKETNAMLSTKVATFASRLAELEEWQRNLYAHSTAATAAGLLGPFHSTQTTTSSHSSTFPPVHGATPSSTFSSPATAQMSKSRHATPVHAVGANVHTHQQSPSAVLGVGPTAILMSGGTLGDNPYLHDYRSPTSATTTSTSSTSGIILSPVPPPSSSSSNSMNGSSSLRRSSNEPLTPVFQIKGGVHSSQSYSTPTSSNGATVGVASPLTALYAALPTTTNGSSSSSASSPPPSSTILLKRPNEQNFLIQSSGSSSRDQPHYTIATQNSNKDSSTLQSQSQPLSSTAAPTAAFQPKPPSSSSTTPSYLQHQMAALQTQRQANANANANTPMLVFPTGAAAARR